MSPSIKSASKPVLVRQYRISSSIFHIDLNSDQHIKMKNPTGSLNEPDGVICFIAQAANNGLENILLNALQIRIGRERQREQVLRHRAIEHGYTPL